MTNWDDRARRPQGTRLRDLLPEYYRENPHLLGPLLEVGETIIGAMEETLQQTHEEWSTSMLSTLKERWFPDRRMPNDAAGDTAALPGPSQAALRAWFRRLWGVEPQVWVGFEAEPQAGSHLVLRRPRHAAAIVLGDRQRSVSLPLLVDLLPLRTRLQVLFLSADEEERPPYTGRGLVGEIHWDSQKAKEDALRGTT